MTKEQMLKLASPYGVIAIYFGGCIKGSPIYPGQPAAMRRSAHAHNSPKWPHYGTICFKAHSPERIRPTLFWHEVGHIWRRSWTEKQCNKWAWQQARTM